MTTHLISTFLTRSMLFLFLALTALALGLGACWFDSFTLIFLIALLALPLLSKLLIWSSGRLARLGAAKAGLLLATVCFFVKVTWILAVHPELEGDYAVYWNTALDLAEDNVLTDGRYVALFPHIFGYSGFLSILIRLFGPSALLAQWTNVVLSVCAGLLLFQLGRCWLNLEAGISAFLLWIVCPSQTMYNSLVLADLFYTTLLLAFLLLVVFVHRHAAPDDSPPPSTGSKALFLSAIAGIAAALLLRLFNAVRPIAAVPIISLLIWVLLLRGRELTDRHSWLRWLPFLVLTVGLYAATGPLWDACTERHIGEEPAGTPGYSVYVGFNQETGGTYNTPDMDLLYHYSNTPGATAQWAQEQMMIQARERIASGLTGIPGLMFSKLRTFLSTDTGCVAYNASVLPHNTKAFSGLCNIIYFSFLMLALLGGCALWKQQNQSSALLLPLYVLGLTLAQMLVEVAPRYHYSLIPVFLLIGQFSLFGRRSPSPAPERAASP